MEQRSGCERCKTWEEEIYWKHFSSLHFFQSLPKDFHHHLVLPAKFAENMIAKLPDKVSLIGPSATMWDIELIKKIDNIAFGGDGWNEFVKAYDLEENNLLMFKYKQNSSFEVLIFDPESFCEKEASYFVKQCRHAKKAAHENEKKRTVSEAFSMEGIEDEDNDNDDHNDSEFVVSKKSRNDNDKELQRRKNPPRTPRKGVLRAPQPRGRPKRTLGPCESRSQSKAQSEKEPEENGLVHDVVEDEPEENGAAKELSHSSEREPNTLENGGSVLETAHSHRSTQKKGRPKKRLATKSSRKLALQSDSAEKYATEYKSNRRPVTEIEKKNALSRALQGLTESSFIAVMRPSAVYKRFYLNIPADWMNKYLLRSSHEVVLRIGEKTWVASFYCNSTWRALKGCGWKKFVLDNFLEEFDACVFKLASQKHDLAIVMDVEIFRVVPEIVPPSPVVGPTSA